MEAKKLELLKQTSTNEQTDEFKLTKQTQQIQISESKQQKDINKAEELTNKKTTNNDSTLTYYQGWRDPFLKLLSQQQKQMFNQGLIYIQTSQSYDQWKQVSNWMNDLFMQILRSLPNEVGNQFYESPSNALIIKIMVNLGSNKFSQQLDNIITSEELQILQQKYKKLK